MRLDPKLVHPSLFKATDGVMWGTGYKMTDMGAVTAHQTAWFKEYGPGCLAWCSGALALFIGSVVTMKALEIDKPVRLFTMLALLLAFAAAGGIASVRHARKLSVTELKSLIPLLKLSETCRAYAETIVALHRSDRSKEEIEETMTALNALLDEDEKLVASREAISGSQTGHDRESLAAEREKIAARIAGARDPDAKAAFEGSLTLVEERIASFDGIGSALERIEAHQELLRQAVLATRDAALHRGVTPALPDLGTDALRSAVARAREQTQETERALAELRAI